MHYHTCREHEHQQEAVGTYPRTALEIIAHALYHIVTWTIEIEEAAAREIRSFPDDLKGYVARIFSLITEDEPQDLPPDLARQIDVKLWELRLRARSGIGRALYFTADPSRLIVVSAFVKKSQKLPDHERQKAKARMNARLNLETARKEGKIK